MQAAGHSRNEENVRQKLEEQQQQQQKEHNLQPLESAAGAASSLSSIPDVGTSPNVAAVTPHIVLQGQPPPLFNAVFVHQGPQPQPLPLPGATYAHFVTVPHGMTAPPLPTQPPMVLVEVIHDAPQPQLVLPPPYATNRVAAAAGDGAAGDGRQGLSSPPPPRYGAAGVDYDQPVEGVIYSLKPFRGSDETSSSGAPLPEGTHPGLTRVVGVPWVPNGRAVADFWPSPARKPARAAVLPASPLPLFPAEDPPPMPITFES